MNNKKASLKLMLAFLLCWILFGGYTVFTPYQKMGFL